MSLHGQKKVLKEFPSDLFNMVVEIFPDLVFQKQLLIYLTDLKLIPVRDDRQHCLK